MDTSNGTTFPFNTPNSTHVAAEWQYGTGENLRFLLGGSYTDYRASNNALIPAGVQSQILYGDINLGLVFATTWVEWRFVYSRFQMPFTYVYSVSNPTPTDPFAKSYYLVPYSASGDVFRLESVMYAKANAYLLAFHYYFGLASAVPLPDTVGGQTTPGGQATGNYFLGGCVRVFVGGDKFRIGPAICVDLQEMYLPNSVVLNRQEVGARLTTEF